MEIAGLEFERLYHDCFRISGSVTVYTDPYGIDRQDEADVVFVGHEHYDHCSPEDVAQVASDGAVVVANEHAAEQLEGLDVESVFSVLPGDEGSANSVSFDVVHAYNTDKFRTDDEVYHPKREGHCGYVFAIDGTTVYFAGDTDVIPEMDDVTCDVALLPVSGTYVMTAEEAAEAVEKVQPEVAVPMHYGAIVGDSGDAERFEECASCRVVIL